MRCEDCTVPDVPASGDDHCDCLVNLDKVLKEVRENFAADILRITGSREAHDEFLRRFE